MLETGTLLLSISHGLQRQRFLQNRLIDFCGLSIKETIMRGFVNGSVDTDRPNTVHFHIVRFDYSWVCSVVDFDLSKSGIVFFTRFK